MMTIMVMPARSGPMLTSDSTRGMGWLKSWLPEGERVMMCAVCCMADGSAGVSFHRLDAGAVVSVSGKAAGTGRVPMGTGCVFGMDRLWDMLHMAKRVPFS